MALEERSVQRHRNAVNRLTAGIGKPVAHRHRTVLFTLAENGIPQEHHHRLRQFRHKADHQGAHPGQQLEQHRTVHQVFQVQLLGPAVHIHPHALFILRHKQQPHHQEVDHHTNGNGLDRAHQIFTGEVRNLSANGLLAKERRAQRTQRGK